VQLIEYRDIINITVRTNRAISEVYKGLTERVEETWLKISDKKIKAMVQSRRIRKNKHNTETKVHDIEAVRSIKYLRTVIRNIKN
jgi:hypothetical protein